MKVLKILFLAFLVLFACPASVSALTAAEKYKFAQDDILFVDTCTDLASSTPLITVSTASGTADLAAEQVQFIETYHDIAVTLSTNYGIPWETVMAQGILESASGSSNFARERNNFFGIGAYDSNPENAFSYATPQEGWEGYYKNIVNTSVYRENGVFSRNSPHGDTVIDPIAYAKAIKAAGYATDPDYVSKLTSLINGIQNLSNSHSWPSSQAIAETNPLWYSNAEKYRAGATASSSTSSSGASIYGSTSLPNGCPTTSSTTANQISSTGVTFATYNGHQIAFPIAGATKDMKSQVSDLPCNHSIGCHYGPGVPAGNAAAAFDLCMGDNCDNATVVSMTDGVVTQLTDTRNGVSCNHVRIRSDIDNTVIAYMHLTGEPYTFKEGDRVKAGDVIGHISPGVSPCNDNSMAHVHVDKGSDTSAIGGPMDYARDPALTPMMNAAWNALPANAAELAQRIASESTSSNQNSTLKSGGMTLAEAQKFMQSYVAEAAKQLRGDYSFEGAFVSDSGCPNGTLNNCSAFTQWFLNRYTTLGPSSANIWQGSSAVTNYVSSGQLIYGGKTPKPYAVVSMGPYTGTADGWPNHTSIVLGIDTAKDEIIIGEAGCSASFTPGAYVHSLSEYTNSSSAYGPTYAYTDKVLKSIK
ncbi:MAG: glucosaminidase domain-containing protein [bacterium]|nr:glucosaminidase domain-containing protein [bacterium]